KIPSISDTTYARTITGEVNADKVTSTTNVGNATVYSELNITGFDANSTGKIQGGPGNIISMTKAASITNLTAAAHIMDMSIALRTAIAVGLGRDIYLGGKFSLSLGMSTDIRIGPKFEIITSDADTYNLGKGDSIHLQGAAILSAMVLVGL